MNIPTKYKSVDEYLNQFEGITAERLKILRNLIVSTLPNCEERISYNIPAYFVKGKRVVYFAGYKSHVGLYPGRVLDDNHMELMSGYVSGKSTLKFPNNQGLPLQLIHKFISLRLRESQA